jgi:hypothetical protein
MAAGAWTVAEAAEQQPGRASAPGRPADRDPPRDRISSHLDDRGVTVPAEIGKAVGLPPVEATRLPGRKMRREEDIAALQSVAERSGIEVPPLPDVTAASFGQGVAPAVAGVVPRPFGRPLRTRHGRRVRD